jgi:hypothetical protein
MSTTTAIKPEGLHRLDEFGGAGGNAAGLADSGLGQLSLANIESREARRRRALASLLLNQRKAQARARLNATVPRRAETRLPSPEGAKEREEREARETTAPPTTVEIAASPVAILQRWDGVVLEVNEETFRARLFDERTGRPRIEADIYVSDVPPHDRPLLRRNAIFYWHIGYRDPTGDNERFSRIRFARLPPKTESDLARAEQRAGERQKRFGW